MSNAVFIYLTVEVSSGNDRSGRSQCYRDLGVVDARR